ncbi:MAG: hypothetical protein ACXABY_07950 [Candidatus Thorarchaeota archaeon]
MTVILPTSQNADAGGETERTYPSSVSVTRGTASGTIDDVVGQDGVTYSVVEEDINSGRDYSNTTLNPDGVGTHNEWTGAGCAGDNFGCVDEGTPHDGNTSYISKLWAGGNEWSNDTYTAQDYTLGASYSIDEVRIYGIARNEFLVGPPEGNFYAVCLYSGTTLDCDTAAWTTYIYTEYSNTWTTNPDDLGTWEDADIDALEIGHQAQWQNPGAGPESWATLVYSQVQSSAPLYDYTADFRFSFTGIDFKGKPKLEIAGYRTGDVENIQVQVWRNAAWTTLSADALDTTLTTTQYALSTTDVLGGSATVRIVDADTTDDDQTTIFIDEILILTEDEPPNPQSAIRVQTESEYLMWENRLKVEIFWQQVGGPEQAETLAKWVTVTIDGETVGRGIFPVNGNITYVPVPWGVLDGSLHNGTVIGYVLINWTSGPITYSSEPEQIELDNFIRWVTIVVLLFILMVIVIALFVRRLNEVRLMKEEL